MKKISLIIGIVTVLIVVGGILLVSKNSTPKLYPLPANLTYYWGDGCPHCTNVENFLSSWDKKDQVKITKYEVWNNAANAKEMQARYTYCDVPQSEMGVPLLFTPEGKCYSGDQPIIDYLKSIKY